jgi:hypothetical protein
MFPRVSELKIRINNQWPLSSLRLLSTVIDLSRVVKLRLTIRGFGGDSYSGLMTHLHALLKLACNVCSLELWLNEDYMPVVNDSMRICNIIHSRIRHVTLTVSSIGQMLMVRQHLQHQSSVRFRLTNADCSTDELYHVWSQYQRGSFTYQLSGSSLRLWLDRHTNY